MGGCGLQSAFYHATCLWRHWALYVGQCGKLTPCRETEHHRELLSSCQYCSACSGIPPRSLVTSSLFCFGKQEAPLPQHWERQSSAVSQNSVSSFRLVFKSEVWLYQNIAAARHIGLLFVCCREACRQVLGVLLQILYMGGGERILGRNCSRAPGNPWFPWSSQRPSRQAHGSDSCIC